MWRHRREWDVRHRRWWIDFHVGRDIWQPRQTYSHWCNVRQGALHFKMCRQNQFPCRFGRGLADIWTYPQRHCKSKMFTWFFWSTNMYNLYDCPIVSYWMYQSDLKCLRISNHTQWGFVTASRWLLLQQAFFARIQWLEPFFSFPNKMWAFRLQMAAKTKTFKSNLIRQMTAIFMFCFLVGNPLLWFLLRPALSTLYLLSYHCFCQLHLRVDTSSGPSKVFISLTWMICLCLSNIFWLSSGWKRPWRWQRLHLGICLLCGSLLVAAATMLILCRPVSQTSTLWSLDKDDDVCRAVTPDMEHFALDSLDHLDHSPLESAWPFLTRSWSRARHSENPKLQLAKSLSAKRPMSWSGNRFFNQLLFPQQSCSFSERPETQQNSRTAQKAQPKFWAEASCHDKGNLFPEVQNSAFGHVKLKSFCCSFETLAFTSAFLGWILGCYAKRLEARSGCFVGKVWHLGTGGASCCWCLWQPIDVTKPPGCACSDQNSVHRTWFIQLGMWTETKISRRTPSCEDSFLLCESALQPVCFGFMTAKLVRPNVSAIQHARRAEWPRFTISPRF